MFSAGNKPQNTLGDSSPQRYGTPNNGIISVGSLDAAGRRSLRVTLEGPARDGADPHLIGDLTTWAQGSDVKIAKPYGGVINFEYASGTSFAAPQVGGLIAYYQGLPGSQPLSALDAKRKIISLSRGTNSPDAPGLIYNGVRELMCPATTMSGRDLKKLSVREKVVNRRQELGPQIMFANGQFVRREFEDMVSRHLRNAVFISPLTPVRGLGLMPETKTTRSWILGEHLIFDEIWVLHRHRSSANLRNSISCGTDL